MRVDDGCWVSRKRKNEEVHDSGTSEAQSQSQSPSSATPSTIASTLPVTVIPPSLMPHLGWTKLSPSCPVSERAKKRRKAGRNDIPEDSKKVAGKAIFFVHDPNPQPDSSANDDEGTTWFQGRFFPSLGAQSPCDDTTFSETKTLPSPMAMNSWGLLAVQNDVIDECLRCEEGGYRELDLTVIRHISLPRGRKKAVRWVEKNVVWTGGDMMRLSTDESGIKFEPTTLMGGDKAMNMASKYFPSLLKRLKIHNVTNECGGSNSDDFAETIAVVGDMEIVAPASFIGMKDVLSSGASQMANSDSDGLWDEE